MKRNMHLGANPRIFTNATNLRKRETEPEKILWPYLSDRKMEGVKFRRQHPVKKFVLDFYSHEIKLGIELDGAQHFTSTESFYDLDRTEILEDYHITIIRFSNDDIYYSIDSVIDFIRRMIIWRRDIQNE